MLEVTSDHKQSQFLLSIEKWCNVHAVVIVLSVVLSMYYASMEIFCAVSVLSFVSLFLSQRAFLSHFSPFAGIANWVTMMRFVLLASCFLSYMALGIYWFFGLIVFAVILDVVDGKIARRMGQESSFGQYFDMEVDAFYVMGMALYFYFTTGLGVWLLLPGLLRYIYRILVWWGPHKNFRETKKKYAATFAGLNFALLAIAIPLPTFYQSTVIFAAAMLVTVSFSISFLEYFSHAEKS